MGVMSTGLVAKGLRAEFISRLDQTPVYWPDLCTRIPSTTKSETYGWLGSVPQLREWGTGRLAKGLRSESYSVENLKYESTIEVDRDEIDDDQTGGIRMRVNEMAGYAATHKDYLIEQLLVNGETAGFHSYDGVPFFSAAHEVGESDSQSNKLTYAAVAADAPTAAEFRGAIAQAIATMVAYKSDVGNPMRIQPRPEGFVCIVPPTMIFTALEALDLALAPSAANPVARNIVQGAARVISLPGLTDASKWYLCKTDVPVRPFIFQDRRPMEFAALDKSDDTEVFLREKYLYGCTARYRIAYGYWQYCVRTDFT